MERIQERALRVVFKYKSKFLPNTVTILKKGLA